MVLKGLKIRDGAEGVKLHMFAKFGRDRCKDLLGVGGRRHK